MIQVSCSNVKEFCYDLSFYDLVEFQLEDLRHSPKCTGKWITEVPALH